MSVNTSLTMNCWPTPSFELELVLLVRPARAELGVQVARELWRNVAPMAPFIASSRRLPMSALPKFVGRADAWSSDSP